VPEVVSRRVKREIVSGRRMGAPPWSSVWAKRATSSAVENRPAWPATPPRTKAFSSWTSPWMTRLRNVLRGLSWLALCGDSALRSSRTGASAPHFASLSSAVGGIFIRKSVDGLNVVLVIASGPKISRLQNASSFSCASRSRATPKMMKPMSLYSAWVPGSAVRGIVNAALRSSSRDRACRKSFL